MPASESGGPSRKDAAMPTPSRVPRGVVVAFAFAAAIGAAVLLGSRQPRVARGPNHVCNGSFEEGAFVDQGDVEGQDVMHVPNGSFVLVCDADRTRGWR